MAVRKLPSGRYQVRVSSRGKDVASRTFDRKADADAFDREQKTALAAGTWTNPEKGQTTVEELSVVFLATKAHRTPTYRGGLESTIRRHILPDLGRRPISSVSPSGIDVWVSQMLRDHSVHTTRKAAGILRQMFALAVRDSWISRSPVEHLRLPQQPRVDPKPLTIDQLERLAAATESDRDRMMVLVMGYGGLRFGELAALRVACIDGDKLFLRQSVTHPKGGVKWGDLKSHKSRTVVLPSSVAADLWSLVSGKDEGALVFASSAGTPLRGSVWSHVISRASKRAGLHRVRAHDLRDTAASLAIDAGVSVVVVSKMLGHEDASVTLRHYANFFPDDLDVLAARLDGARRSNGTSTARVSLTGVEK